MSKILLFRDTILRELSKTIDKNLDKYRTGSFDFLRSDSSNFIEVDQEINMMELQKITGTKDNMNEVECCLGAFRGLPNISPAFARDPRLWVYMTHIVLLEYCRQRWPIPKDDTQAVSHIRKHFFAVGARGVERDNAVSRLWWMAFICNKVQNMPFEKVLNVFLFKSDVRANIVERPSTSQNVAILSAVVNKLDKSFNGDQLLYDRKKFRPFMEELNLQGGIKLLDVLDDKEIQRIVNQSAR